MRDAHKISDGKSDGKRPLVRPRRRYEGDIKRARTAMKWLRTSSSEHVVGSCKLGNKPSSFIKGEVLLDQLSFSRSIIFLELTA